MIACDFKGTRFDVGDQLGFIKANIEYGLKRDTIAPALKEYLKALVKSFN